MNTLESIIQTDYFHHLMSQELIPPSIKLLSLKNIEGEEIQQSILVAPPIDDLNLEEKEILFFLSQKIGSLNYPCDKIILHFKKQDFLNLLAYIIRETRFSWKFGSAFLKGTIPPFRLPRFLHIKGGYPRGTPRGRGVYQSIILIMWYLTSSIIRHQNTTPLYLENDHEVAWSSSKSNCITYWYWPVSILGYRINWNVKTP